MNAVMDIILQYIIYIGYPGIFLAMFLEGLSIPFPGAYFVIFVGILVGSGLLNFWTTLAAGVLGFTLGSMGPFFLTFLWGRKILALLKRWNKGYSKKLLFGKKLFRKYGPSVVVFSRPLLCGKYTSYFAGMAKMYPIQYFCCTLLGAYLWCGGLLHVGMFFKKSWQGYYSISSVAIPGIFLVFLIYFVYTKLYRRKFI